jgi:hypothetical protein
MYLLKRNRLIGLCLLALVIASCSKTDDRKNLIGIWRLAHLNVNGMEVSDGKGFVEFKEDGRNIVRIAPYRYEWGNWEMKVDSALILMKDERSAAPYNYQMMGDSLVMTLKLPNRISTLRLVKTDKYPIDPETEGQAAAHFK